MINITLNEILYNIFYISWAFINRCSYHNLDKGTKSAFYKFKTCKSKHTVRTIKCTKQNNKYIFLESSHFGV